jgi:hypothetical protein
MTQQRDTTACLSRVAFAVESSDKPFRPIDGAALCHKKRKGACHSSFSDTRSPGPDAPTSNSMLNWLLTSGHSTRSYHKGAFWAILKVLERFKRVPRGAGMSDTVPCPNHR